MDNIVNDEKNLIRLKKFLNVFDDENLTKQEFIDAFKNVTDLVLKIEKRNMEAIDQMEKTYQNVLESLKSSSNTGLSDIKRLTEGQLNAINSQVDKRIGQIEAKVAMVKDGKDADEERVVMNTLMRMPKMEMDKPEQLRSKLETLQGNDRLDVNSINGLDEKLQSLRDMITRVSQSRSFGGPNANAVQYVDLTAQCNGSLKAFEVPRHRVALSLQGTQAPFIYRPVTDFTTANKTLTLTAEVSAPATSQTLIFTYIK